MRMDRGGRIITNNNANNKKIFAQGSLEIDGMTIIVSLLIAKLGEDLGFAIFSYESYNY